MTDKADIVIAGGFSYPSGYAATQLVQTAISYFHQHGYKVRVLSWGVLSGEGALTCGTWLGVPYTVLPVFRGMRALQAIFSGLRFIASARSKGVSMLFYGFPDVRNFHLLVAAKMLRVKIVFWIVEDYSVYDLKNCEQGASRIQLIMHRFFSPCMRFFADGIFVLSSALQKKYQAEGIRTELIPISAGRLSIHPKPATEIRRNSIVYAGTFGQKDGVEDLIHAFREVVIKIPDARLELVGSGPRMSVLKAACCDVPNMHFLGYLDDDQYEETLSTAHVLCMTRIDTPYANAGFPYKICDYLTMGRPVLATRVSDIDRYLVDKESALLVDAGNQRQIASALEYLLSFPEEADRIGAVGRQVCERYFNPETNGALIENFIGSL